MFTDSTEKQAVEPYETKYDNTNKPRDANDLAYFIRLNTEYANSINQIDNQIYHQHYIVYVNNSVKHSMNYITVQ